MTRRLPTLARFVAPRLPAVHQLLMLCVVFAFASCSAAFAQDVLRPGRMPAKVDGAGGFVCVDPTSGAPYPCGGYQPAGLGGSASSTATLSNFPAVLANVAPGAQSFTAQWTSAGTGNSAAYEGSNDGSNWFSLNCQAAALSGLGSSTTNVFTVSSTNPITCWAGGFRQIRIRISSYTSGTPTADVQFNSTNSPLVAIVGTLRMQNLVSDGSVQTAITSAITASGSGVTAVEEDGRPSSNINSNATTTVKSGAGFLHTICVNTKGASANTATVYDNTAGSGTKLATIDTTTVVGCLIYDLKFATGLTVVTATGTAADLTVSYR